MEYVKYDCKGTKLLTAEEECLKNRDSMIPRLEERYLERRPTNFTQKPKLSSLFLTKLQHNSPLDCYAAQH